MRSVLEHQNHKIPWSFNSWPFWDGDSTWPFQWRIVNSNDWITWKGCVFLLILDLLLLFVFFSRILPWFFPHHKTHHLGTIFCFFLTTEESQIYVYSPEIQHGTWKWWFPKGISFSRDFFSGSMLNFRGVYHSIPSDPIKPTWHMS